MRPLYESVKEDKSKADKMFEDEIIQYIEEHFDEVYKDCMKDCNGDEDIFVFQYMIKKFKKELEQEKEKAEELLKDREKSTEEYIHNNPWLYKQLAESYILKFDVKKDYISKDKIRAKIKELEEKSEYWNCDEIEVLKELLEEN